MLPHTLLIPCLYFASDTRVQVLLVQVVVMDKACRPYLVHLAGRLCLEREGSSGSEDFEASTPNRQLSVDLGSSPSKGKPIVLVYTAAPHK